jgi:hypothetical protein
MQVSMEWKAWPANTYAQKCNTLLSFAEVKISHVAIANMLCLSEQ